MPRLPLAFHSVRQGKRSGRKNPVPPTNAHPPPPSPAAVGALRKESPPAPRLPKAATVPSLTAVIVGIGLLSAPIHQTQASREPATVDAVNLDLVGAFVDLYHQQIPQICRVGIAQILGKSRRGSRDSAKIKPEEIAFLRQKEIPNAAESGAVLLLNQTI